MSATISTESTTAVIPAPRTAPDTAAARRRQRPADQYWNVFEASWCLLKAGVKAAADIS